ncbi:insulin-like growth factor-binding protein complex acid labile subunit [Scaptodrosophila lebanonensis]|uniref:Insulin-like growth factor-binding protein complex acid labile subunit n=1 Tax=Drosophila lebanonensis TaxID=7225 RepID=A0A6J2T708_DROLE|nr:insulin-like growth factor-binding protein complex acid labile subunit [Scaptodrosophila lebanonensis]XP_030371790.1 insulin-like growth factor-binding protein complex acid labile subunit [Scaptodrosophila lebanonensis]XP_030371792.1 insulin-like growth factor-binding protein complex acid labile subunit [Scaptodrosophila lebanonensis]
MFLRLSFAQLSVLLTWLAIGAQGLDCPAACRCAWVLDSLEVNCSDRGLSVYPSLENVPVEHLDLSGNLFREFPKQYADIESLMYLDLSNNRISQLDAGALIGFTSLRTLLLANNSIVNWSQLNPSETFWYATNLKHLNLSGNRLDSFINEDASQQLSSQSLTHLDLSSCGISVVGGDHLNSHLPNLERLILSNNKLTQISTLHSDSLRLLDLSNCSLQRVNSMFIAALPSLEQLYLSYNSQLQFGSRDEDLIIAYSLRQLDASYSNLDDIDLRGLPALTNVRLRGNLLRSVDSRTFENNTQLEFLDLSENMVRLIGAGAFNGLKRLKQLNLAYNEIARLDRNVISSNDVLLDLNLSHNVIQKLTKIVSNSVRFINMSWCEITAIDSMAFSGLSAIQHLDLSHNLIGDVPSLMHSETLRSLDLSNCRLSTVRNTTFKEFPELSTLRLNGNRLTNAIPPSHFRENKFLDQIWLGDNPWICGCRDQHFIEFYDYLTTKPARVRDRNHLRCGSPANNYGKLWENACMGVWMANVRSSHAEEVWSNILIGIIVIGAIILIYSCLRKAVRKHKVRHDRREYAENRDELQRIRDINERMLQEERPPVRTLIAQETNLPSYEDALRMPKLVRPVKSMGDLTGTGRSRKQLRRSQTQQDGEQSAGEDELQLDSRQRFRSVEMLSNRDKERTAQYAPFRRTGYMEYSQSGSRRFSIEDSRFPAAHLKTQNLQSAEQIGNFQSYENSPYTKRKPKIAEIPPFKRINLIGNSVEFLTDPEDDLSSKQGSPFAKRKPKLPPVVHVQAQVYALEQKLTGVLEPAIEDYYSPTQKAVSSSTIASDFQELVEPELTSLPDDSRSTATTSDPEQSLERGKRKKRKNSASRRASGNFNAAVDGSVSSSDDERSIQARQPMRETLF